VPLFSKERGVELLTKEECVSLFGSSLSTVNRALKKPFVYTEYMVVNRPGHRGATRVLYVDPETLQPHLGKSDIPKSSEYQVQDVKKITVVHDAKAAVAQQKPTFSPLDIKSSECHENLTFCNSVLDAVDFSLARAKLAKLEPILQLGERTRERSEAVKILAKAEGVTVRAVYKWIKAFSESGLKGLANVTRSDKGRHHISADAYSLIKHGLISNSRTTPPPQVHRMLLRSVPDAMTREYGGKLKPISERTVANIKQEMLSNPHERLLFFDEDKRKEHLRVWVGEVFAAHANELWQMDMTRCDVKVCVPETRVIDRPRIHAIIDVYSGCIPGWVFSFEEDQSQTDLALRRALTPRADERWARAWPVYGIPKRMYWDNGKTYRSKQAERIMAALGVEVIHSRPRVSWTRGKIERFFRALHDFERTLPGYAGADVKSKATDELKRLERNTKHWMERGLSQDPGYGERLLTMNEYQYAVLSWLIGDYQNPIEGGKTRLDYYRESVIETNTQHLISPEDLFLLIARRDKRRVEGNGQIRFGNRRWAILDGSLINYQNLPVWVLQDQFAIGEDRLWIAYEERNGKLTALGVATPAPTRRCWRI